MDQEQPRILILHASAGHGHLKAAESIKEALEELSPKCSVELHDALDFFPSWIKKMYVSSYLFMITKAKYLWKLVYASSDCKLTYPITAVKRRIFNGFFGKDLEKKITEYNPDVVVSTHFMPPEIISHMNKNNDNKIKDVTIITDYLVHRFWIHRSTTQYLVACEKTKKVLVEESINESKVMVTGIPVGRSFATKKSKQATCEKLKIDPDKFTALFTSGGMGASSIEGLVEDVARDCIDTQLLVVSGNNVGLKSKIDSLANKYANIISYGFVDNMDELMDASDLLVGKAGGSTVSEALAKKVPMIILEPVPGQERFNADVLIEEGAATELLNPSDLPQIIRDHQSESEVKSRIDAAIEKLSKPDSSMMCAKVIMDITSS